MSNLTTTLENANSTSTMSIEELLNSLSLDPLEIIITSFFLSFINLLGTVFCSISAWIFFKRQRFNDPVFFFYRLLCIVNIIHLAHNIPRGFIFSSRLFPSMNTYLCSMYNLYYSLVSGVLYHYEDALQIAILLTKMKHFIPFVKRHFTASPPKVSLALFLTCVCIDFPFVSSFSIGSLGTYYYFDSNGVKQTATYYRPVTSAFSMTPTGRSLSLFFILFLNFFLSLLIGVFLNIFSYVKYKSYQRQRIFEKEQLQMSSTHNSPVVSREIEQINERERIEHKIEKNMFHMALTLCSISIVSRILFMFIFVLFLFYFSVSSNNITSLVNYLIYTTVPTLAIFVFYSFNQVFREEIKNTIQINISSG